MLMPFPKHNSSYPLRRQCSMPGVAKLHIVLQPGVQESPLPFEFLRSCSDPSVQTGSRAEEKTREPVHVMANTCGPPTLERKCRRNVRPE
jgi:hypothetical protein